MTAKEEEQWKNEVKEFYQKEGWQIYEGSEIYLTLIKDDDKMFVKTMVCHNALVDLTHLIETDTHAMISENVNARRKGRLFIKYISSDGKLSSHYLTWEQVLVVLSSGTGKVSILETLPLGILCGE